MPPLTTAQEMGPEHLPEGARPEEFLRDADLIAYYERALAAAKPGERAALRAHLKLVRRGAALTAAALADIDTEPDADTPEEEA